MKLHDFLEAGYKRFETKGCIGHTYSSFGLQRLFFDDKGKRYYITAYVYDETYIGGYYLPQRFSPTVQFQLENRPTVDMEFITREDTELKEIEDMVYKAWVLFGSEYYSNW